MDSFVWQNFSTLNDHLGDSAERSWEFFSNHFTDEKLVASGIRLSRRLSDDWKLK